MKKFTLILMLSITSFLLVSCFENTPKPSDNVPPPPTQSQDIPSDTSSIQDSTSDAGTTSQQADTGSFDTVADAVSKRISLKCTYTDADKSVTTLYIKSDNIFIEWNSDNKDWSINWVIKWDVIYMWNGSAWLKLNLSTSPKDSIKIWKQSITSQSDLLDVVNSQKDNCSKQDIDDSKFEIPSDVEFKTINETNSTESGSGN